MASDSRALTLKLLADTADFQKKLQEGSKDVDSIGEKAKEFGKKAAAAFALAGAAVGAFAVAAVKAAAEDEQAQIKLAETIRSTTKATDEQIKGVEKYITQTSIAAGITDDELRPAFSRLVRSTNDVEDAQKLLNLALDLSAATGKPLEAVTNALGRAYDGNTTALGKLGLGIDAADLKSQDFDTTFNQLTDTFGNFSENAAQSTQKQMERVKIALDEAKESIGAALLPVVQELTQWILNNFIPALDAFIAGLTGSNGLDKSLTDTQKTAVEWGKKVRGFIETVISLKDELFLVAKVLATVFVVSKIAAGVQATILLIQGLVAAYTALRNSAVAAAIASRFALNPLAGLATGAAVVGAIIAATKLFDTEANKGTKTGGNAVNPASLPFGISVAAKGGSSAPSSISAPSLSGGLSGGSSSASVAKMMKDIKTPSGQVFTSPIPNARLGAEGDYLNQNTGVVINVNAPSVIDEEGFTRAVVSALNNTGRRTGAGVEQLAL